jgi:hypothetical protein
MWANGYCNHETCEFVCPKCDDSSKASASNASASKASASKASASKASKASASKASKASASKASKASASKASDSSSKAAGKRKLNSKETDAMKKVKTEYIGANMFHCAAKNCIIASKQAHDYWLKNNVTDKSGIFGVCCSKCDKEFHPCCSKEMSSMTVEQIEDDAFDFICLNCATE